MAVSGLLLAHRLRGLEVRGLVESQIPENVVVVDSGDLLGVELRILTTHVDEIPRQIQIALLTGRIIQLRQRQFDFRMPISTVDLAVLRAEIGIDAIRHTARHVKRLLVTGHLMIGDSSLNIVAHDIHFMALLNQCETLTMRPFTGFDLVRSVQISVRLLRTRDEVDGFIAQFPQLRIRMIRQCVSRFLQPLIYVGILEDHAMKFTGLITGCGAIVMDEENKQFTLAGKTYHEGDWLSLDGSTGNIYDGAMPTVDASVGGDFGRIMAWADKFRRLQVRTNADTPHDAAKARELGAQGIGLCRTEHMFFESDRIAAIREMICSDTVEQREKALAKLLPMQQGDFEGIYEAMEGCPVTIRFLDPPLHEFVPTEEADIELLAKDMGKTVAEIKAIIASLHEFNPMMGHRGCRLAVTFPEIAVMQTRAVIRAAINVQKRHPEWNMVPEIMIPLVGEVKELKYVKSIVVKTADEELAAAGVEMKYLVGTMIEIPRAALTADEIATEAEFFSFGTNDLTQMTFGFSRDDAGKFLGAYYDKKIYENDPFAKLDQVGVGKLVKMAAKLGRETRPELHLGICGEHGGDPSSVEFCHKVGLDYVSCSPFRVPIARLAAAQAAIKDGRN